MSINWGSFFFFYWNIQFSVQYTMTDVSYKGLCMYLYFVYNTYNKLQYICVPVLLFSQQLSFIIIIKMSDRSYWCIIFTLTIKSQNQLKVPGSGIMDRILSWCLWIHGYSVSIRMNLESRIPYVCNSVPPTTVTISLVRALTSPLLAWIHLSWRFGSTSFPILM